MLVEEEGTEEGTEQLIGRNGGTGRETGHLSSTIKLFTLMEPLTALCTYCTMRFADARARPSTMSEYKADHPFTNSISKRSRLDLPRCTLLIVLRTCSIGKI